MNKLLHQLTKFNDLPIYIAGHINPDQDSICSSLSLALFLENLGKQCHVLLDPKDKDIISWNPCDHLIIHNISEQDYVFIALDMNEVSRLGAYEHYFHNAKYTINIDHHQNNKNEANYIISDTLSSSTCEMIFQLITSHSPMLLTTKISEYLYSGMLNDTNCFSRRLSSKTLSIAQTLINQNIDYYKIINKTYSQRSLYEFQALAKAITEIKYDEFHYLIIDKALPEYQNLTINQINKKIAEDLRKIIGIDTFILLIKEQEKVVGKCMTNTSDNAHIIAELFNGGGHAKEAGFTTYSHTTENILNTIKIFLKQNKKNKTI